MQRYSAAILFHRFRLSTLRSSSILNISISRVWWAWIIILAVTFLIQVSTIDVMPSLQKDEIQIADYGRLTLDPSSDWSVNWLVAEGKPILLWSYLGPLLSETSYQLFGSSGLGPRIVALLGGLLAATMALGWLLARRVPLYAAFCLAFAFLLDPLFVLSQRMARVDSWVIALCLAACWILRASNLKKPRYLWARIMSAGALSAVAALIWPSSIFLYPLILLEFALLFKSDITNVPRWKNIALNGSCFIGGGVLAVAILIIPVWQNLYLIYHDMPGVLSKNVESSRSLTTRLLAIFDYHLWLKLIKAFGKTLSILLPLLALFGSIYRREKGLIIVSFFVVILIFATLVYELRVLYLLPYLVALGGNLFEHVADTPSSAILSRIRMAALGTLTTWALVTSLFVRSALGLEGKAKRDRNKIVGAAKDAIGNGNFKVFLGFTYEFYYAGRSLGWKLYTPYGQQDYDAQGNWIDKGYNPHDKFVKLFSEMDYAIFSNGAITKELSEELAVSGLAYETTMMVSNQSGDGDETGQSRTKQLILFYMQGNESYGPYVLYKRQKNRAVLSATHL